MRSEAQRKFALKCLAEIAVVGQQRFGPARLFRQSIDLLQHRCDLLLVGEPRPSRSPEGFRSHHRLRVVALFKPAARHWHDARVFVGQVDLILGLRPLERWCRGAAAGLLPIAAVFSSRAASLVGAVLGYFPLKAFFGAGFRLGARLGKLRQTLFSARQFLRNRP